MFPSDERLTLKTLDFAFYIGSTPMTNLFIFWFVSQKCLRSSSYTTLSSVKNKTIGLLIDPISDPMWTLECELRSI